MTSTPAAPPAASPAPSSAPAPATRKAGGGVSFASAFGRGLLGLALVGGAVGLGVVASYKADLPPAETVLAAPAPQGLRLQDARGLEYSWLGAPASRMLGLQEISPDLDRVLTAAAPRLWAGAAPSAVSRALAEGFGAARGDRGEDVQPQRLLRSLAAQWRYGPEERKRLTLNRVGFGEGVHGFDSAAVHWFGRSASGLDLAQSAALVGALEAPPGADPFADREAARGRAERALDFVAEARLATPHEIAAARARPARPVAAGPQAPDPVFAAWALSQAPAEARAPGADMDLRTTLDLRLQFGLDRAFETALSAVEGLDRQAEAAAVLLSRDGAVRAMAGGRRIGESGDSNRATALKRPIGMLFTPFAAPAAMAKGGGGAATISAMLRPGARLGEVNQAAMNLPYAELRKISRALGFDAEPPAAGKTASGPRATALQVAGALATLANDGFAVTPFGVVEALGPGETPQAPRRAIYRRAPEALGARPRAASDQATRLTLRALEQRARLDPAAIRAAPLGRQIVGVGSATSEDVWFMGATADFICVVWLGRDDGKPMAGAEAGLAADLWRAILTEAYAALPIPPRPAPGAASQARQAVPAEDWRPSMNWPNYGADQRAAAP